MDRSTTLLVKTFNDLPRAEILASHRGPNEWYFDLRYIQFEPNPHHSLYLAQTLDSIYHLEPLPAGLPANRSGLEFFPETGREAAPEVVKGIMYAFLHRMGGKASPFAPWRLTTPDKRLLAAVNAEFRRIGIHSSLEVTETTFLAHCLTDDCFAIQYNNLKKKMGYTGIGYASLLCPDDICFPDVADAVPPLVIGKDDWHICTAYVRHVMEARPIDEIADSMSVIANMTQEVRQLQERLQSVPEAVVRVQADGGDYEAAFDYGLRLRFGLGCTANRQLSRVYLMKALGPPLSSDTFKATVHAALIEWYVDSRKDGVLKNRYLCAAAHHAKSAILYARRVDPNRKYYCNAVLGFAKTLIDLNERANTIEQIRTLYDDVIQVSKKRSKQVDEERKKLAQKRMKTPHRYRCASAGCRIQSDTGKMLQRCSGNCDLDKKPSYCSKECQKADWKNHKPFCRPGAECSVLDDGSLDAPLQGGYTPKDGTLQIPVTYADGSTMYFSTSTLEPKALKEMAESLAKQQPAPGSRLKGLPKAWKIDVLDAGSHSGLNISCQ
ncbi:hypothetical protein BJ912DRAFT_677958 [Pholiota molesta]|nr:hypothetical protein BJ912DRAFT_677958 [Pholiota molesta]